jgi:hypothetical protein
MVCSDSGDSEKELLKAQTIEETEITADKNMMRHGSVTISQEFSFSKNPSKPIASKTPTITRKG